MVPWYLKVGEHAKPFDLWNFVHYMSCGSSWWSRLVLFSWWSSLVASDLPTYLRFALGTFPLGMSMPTRKNPIPSYPHSVDIHSWSAFPSRVATSVRWSAQTRENSCNKWSDRRRLARGRSPSSRCRSCSTKKSLQKEEAIIGLEGQFTLVKKFTARKEKENFRCHEIFFLSHGLKILRLV